MREIRKSGSEGGAGQNNVPFLPLSLAFASHTLSSHFRISEITCDIGTVVSLPAYGWQSFCKIPLVLNVRSHDVCR